RIPFGASPTAIRVGNGALWTANTGDSTVTRIDAKTRRVVKTIAVPGPPSALAAAGRHVWALLLYQPNPSRDPFAGDAGLALIDTSVNDVLGSFRLSAGFYNTFDDALAADGRDLWAVDGGVVSRVDPVRESIVARLPLEGGSSPGVAAGFGAVWVLGSTSVKRIDTASNTVVASIPITGGTGPGPAPDAVAVGEGAVWVANRAVPRSSWAYGTSRPAPEGTVSRIDPRTNAV